ncbi:porin [Thalassoglobus sp. JC818]|uniref:OprO/OprP family phosphate-selective porin n=1 Tax=Thalassoglobus sp. JC818 TaxID=3232136 RepID=UPI0034592DD8
MRIPEWITFSISWMILSPLLCAQDDDPIVPPLPIPILSDSAPIDEVPPEAIPADTTPAPAAPVTDEDAPPPVTPEQAEPQERLNLTDFEFKTPTISEAIEQETKYPTLHWSGFLQLDSGWVVADEETIDIVGDISSQFGLRRVRLRAGGRVRENASYVVDLDFAASGHPSFRDVALIFSEVPVIQNIEAGYFKQPYGMDAESSGRELLLLERQSPFAMTPFRQTGIRAFGTFPHKSGTYAFSAYRFPTNAFGVSSGNNGGWGLATRETLLVVDREDFLIHLGGGYTLIDPSTDELQFSYEPGFFIGDPASPDSDSVPQFVNTGEIPTRVANYFNTELAFQWKCFRAQAEYRWTVVNRIDNSAVRFHAGYLQAGLMLTGEHAIYNRSRGIFSGVLPKRDFGDDAEDGFGAIELTGGLSHIDLNSEDIMGGSMTNFVTGINWYLNDHARVVVNVTPVNLNNDGIENARSLFFATRLQFEF